MTGCDWAYVALIVATLLVDHFAVWAAFRRDSQIDPPRARVRLWSRWMIMLWTLAVVGIALWTSAGRAWPMLGLTVPTTWRFGAGITLAVAFAALQAASATRIARTPALRTRLRTQFGTLAVVLPHTRPELGRFIAVSLTAGFCEEFVFRGYLIWAFQPWLGWWGAAGLSLLAFVAAHAYQGVAGLLRVGLVGAVLTLVVAIFGSLWPAIALHALLDIGSGVAAWLVLREEVIEKVLA
jgi:membrane protease YdiL (CAAX protease family)